MRDERLRAEKTVWTLKTEVGILSTRKDDAARRDRQREREEGALSARREAVAAAAASEQERLGLATAAKEKLEAEVRQSLGRETKGTLRRDGGRGGQVGHVPVWREGGVS